MKAAVNRCCALALCNGTPLTAFMPRPGGEADKLGNRFEGIWKVDSLVDVFAGDARTVTVEPLGKEDVGIEFIKEYNEGPANGVRSGVR